MYKLNFDGLPVYDPRGTNETDRLIIVDPSVTLAVNAAGSISFSIYPNHPLAGKITRMRGTLELEDDDGTIFRGRILNDEATFYGAKKYTAEGALAFLNDSIVDPYTFPDDFTGQPGYAAAAAPEGNVVAWWLGWLLDKHNAQATADRQIKLGTVTVKDPNNYITRENSKYSNTWETISEKLVGSALGGYVIMRYEDDGNYLDYLAELPRTNPQRVKFAQNLLDLIIKVTGENLFTAILPVGADGLTLAGLPDGPLEGGQIKAGKVIYDPAAEAEYGGRITRVMTWDDVTEAANLQTKAQAALAAGIKMPESITARACDLNGVDGVTPHFRVGQWVQVESAPHGIEAPYPLLELKPNILDPSSTTVCLNTTADKFTAQVRQAQAQAAETTRSAILAASKQFNELVQGASGLYCTPDPQEGGGVIYYLHDKKTLAESTLVMKLAAEAIGFSTDGGSSYPYGFAINGELVMRLIAAEGINAGWINTGILQSLEGSDEKAFFLDLVNGILRARFDELTIKGKTVENIAGGIADTAAAGALEKANEHADQAAAAAAAAALDDFVQAVMDPALANLQKQIDGQIESFFYDYEPALDNAPASGWASDDDKAKHEGDLFFWKSKGYAYRFLKDGGAWKWQLVQDTDITAALAQAAEAKHTADGKSRTFTDTPYTPYDVGDQWYGGPGGTLVCTTARQDGEYNAGDWAKLDDYIDQATAGDIAADAAAAAQRAAEGYAAQAAADAVAAQTQKSIFDKLTNNGEEQGIFLRDGKIYINLSYLKTNVIDLNFLTLAGTKCGIKQGQGLNGTGRTTQGIVIYGNDLDEDGIAKTPYLIVTDEGIRLQTTGGSGSDYSLYLSGGNCGLNGNLYVYKAGILNGDIRADGAITAGGMLRFCGGYLDDASLWLNKNLNQNSVQINAYTSATEGVNIAGWSYLSDAAWVGNGGANKGLVLHGNRITSDVTVVATSDRDKKKDIEPLEAQAAPVAAADAPQEAPSIEGTPQAAPTLAAKYAALMDALAPVRYRYKNEPDDGPRHIGYIYQDAMAALEAAGLTPEDMAAFSAGVDETGAPSLGIAYAELVPLLHMEIKSLKAQINQLLEGK